MITVCSIEGCEHPAQTRGWCAKHYHRWQRHGDALHTERGKPQEWIRSHANYAGDECLKWPFATSGTGYGALSWNGQIITANRAMCIEAHGEPPLQGMDSAHSCGNGHLGCVNPNHLRWATRSENIEDAFKHGRRVRAKKLWLSGIGEAA